MNSLQAFFGSETKDSFLFTELFVLSLAMFWILYCNKLIFTVVQDSNAVLSMELIIETTGF